MYNCTFEIPNVYFNHIVIIELLGNIVIFPLSID